jgi:hypothetical protein
MQEKDMKTAGCICIVSAVTTFPILIMQYLAIFGENYPAQSILSFISLGLFIYIFHSLRRLLNEEFDFHLVDAYITALIWINVGVTVISAVVTSPDAVFSIFGLIALVALGIVMIAFGITLMKLEDPLGGFLKPFCYLSIAQGVCTASVILILLGFLSSIAADVLLALIFFRTADRVSADTDHNR